MWHIKIKQSKRNFTEYTQQFKGSTEEKRHSTEENHINEADDKGDEESFYRPVVGSNHWRKSKPFSKEEKQG